MPRTVSPNSVDAPLSPSGVSLSINVEGTVEGYVTIQSPSSKIVRNASPSQKTLPGKGIIFAYTL